MSKLQMQIKIRCHIFEGESDIPNIFHDQVFYVNSLYISHGAIGTLLSTSNLIKNQKIIKNIKNQIAKKEAKLNMWLIQGDIEKDFETYVVLRRSIFLNILKMLMRGWKVTNSKYTVTYDPHECSICTQNEDLFVKTDCCKGLSCVKCFRKHVLLELETRITYRCIFHRDPRGSGYSIFPSV
jgi:hypothetical protein